MPLRGHFSELAAAYGTVRRTDEDPILYNRDALQGYHPLLAADVDYVVGIGDVLMMDSVRVRRACM